jgi:hypothetical protein
MLKIMKKQAKKKKIKRFDPILKEIISHSIGKIILLATGRKIEGEVKALPTEIKLVKVLYADILFEGGEKIVQIEIQSQKDKTLPERMFRYYYAIREKFGKEPIQIVLFFGKGKRPLLNLTTQLIDLWT